MNWAMTTSESRHNIRHLVRTELLRHADNTLTVRAWCGYTIRARYTMEVGRPCARCVKRQARATAPQESVTV